MLLEIVLYQPFPANWPRYTSKDKLGDWLEQYAVSNDLTVWTSTSILGRPTYDKATRKWRIRVKTPTGERELSPQHLWG